jgi:hypothetical protein
MSRPPKLELSGLPRPERQRYAECAVEGCGRTPRAFSRYCSLHARAFYRTRDPNGRAVRGSELRPYRELAEEYLGRFSDHPAVEAAEAFMASLLADTTLPAALRRELARLRTDGASPRAMLVEFLAVHGLQHYLPHTVCSDASWAFNVGNRVLRVCPLPTFRGRDGRRRPVNLRARVCEALGTHLRCSLGAFASKLWSRIQSDIEAGPKAAASVCEALRSSPL